MKFLSLCTLATGGILSTGCVPATYVNIPAIQGRVVDSHGQPINNAIVEIASRQNTPTATIHTRSDGMFRRREDSRFAILIPGLDPINLTYSVVAKVGDHLSSPKEIHNGFRVWLLQWPQVKDLGDMQVP